MLAIQRLPVSGINRRATSASSFTAFSSKYGRSAAYRRLSTQTSFYNISKQSEKDHLLRNALAISHRPTLITSPNPFSPLHTSRSQRYLSTSQSLFQQAQAKKDPVEEQPRPLEGENSQQSQEGESAKSESKEENTEDKKSEKDDKDAPPPPPHGDKTPWQVFLETARSEFKASKEWNDSTKQLSGSIHDFTESEGVRKAREASEAASKKTSQVLKSSARALGQGAAWTWDTKVVQGVRSGVNATGRGIERATRPIRETKTYKDISDAMDDGSSSRYGGWVEKEERHKMKEARELKEGKKVVEKMEEDPNAGVAVTVHKDAAWKEQWNKFKDNSKVMQRLFNMKTTYEESENPLISTARSISDRVAGFFAENETAMVIKKFREMDPNFQLEPFLRDMREYILPEVLDAYVKADLETLKLWLSAAQFQVYSALMERYTKAGLTSDGKILDIRNVDILNARLLEPGDIPVFIITCRTQEVHVYRNAKTKELSAGMEDKVQQVTYAIGVTRLPEEVNNAETRGWRMIELQKAARDYI